MSFSFLSSILIFLHSCCVYILRHGKGGNSTELRRLFSAFYGVLLAGERKGKYRKRGTLTRYECMYSEKTWSRNEWRMGVRDYIAHAIDNLL